MKSAIVKRSVVIHGHKTSVSLEQPFWNIVRAIAADEHMTVSALLRRIDEARQHANLSSAVRVYVLEQVRSRAAHPAANENSAAPEPRRQSGQGVAGR